MDNTRKNKFNIVDTFVILILLALIFGVTFFLLRESNNMYAERNEKNITYTICISGLDEEYIATFATGDRILNSSTLNYIGTVTRVEKRPVKQNGDKALPGAVKGEYVLEQKEAHGTYDVYITLTSKAKLDSRGVAYIDSERITIGSQLNIRCDNFAAATSITVFSLS